MCNSLRTIFFVWFAIILAYYCKLIYKDIKLKKKLSNMILDAIGASWSFISCCYIIFIISGNAVPGVQDKNTILFFWFGIIFIYFVRDLFLQTLLKERNDKTCLADVLGCTWSFLACIYVLFKR